MQVKTLTVSVRRTISTAPYETVVVEFQETVELDEDDDPAEVRSSTYANVTKAVKKATDNEHRKYENSAEERKSKR